MHCQGYQWSQKYHPRRPFL